MNAFIEVDNLLLTTAAFFTVVCQTRKKEKNEEEEEISFKVEKKWEELGSGSDLERLPLPIDIETEVVFLLVFVM